MKPRPRKLLKLGLFLLLGAIVNVALAWGRTHYVLDRFGTTPGSGSPATESDRKFWIDNAPADIKGLILDSAMAEVSNFAVHRKVISSSSVYFPGDPNKSVVYGWWREIRAGWPLMCVVGEMWVWQQGHQPGRTKVMGSVKRKTVIINGHAGFFLPAEVLWPGFAINTLFYAAVLRALFAAPGFIRRRRRIKRGLCPACAYPIGASETCTECGHRLIASPASTD